MTSPNLHSPLVLVGLDVDVDAVSDDGSEDLNVVVDGKKDSELTDGEIDWTTVVGGRETDDNGEESDTRDGSIEVWLGAEERGGPASSSRRWSEISIFSTSTMTVGERVSFTSSENWNHKSSSAATDLDASIGASSLISTSSLVKSAIAAVLRSFRVLSWKNSLSFDKDSWPGFSMICLASEKLSGW